MNRRVAVRAKGNEIFYGINNVSFRNLGNRDIVMHLDDIGKLRTVIAFEVDSARGAGPSVIGEADLSRSAVALITRGCEGARRAFRQHFGLCFFYDLGDIVFFFSWNQLIKGGIEPRNRIVRFLIPIRKLYGKTLILRSRGVFAFRVL